jgi:PAS domain S-box-containing protein
MDNLSTRRIKFVDFFDATDINPYYKLLFKNINAVIYIIDRKGRLIYLNDFAEKISHYKLKELLGRHFLHIVAPESREIAIKTYKVQLSGKNIKPYELVVINKDGEKIHLKTSEHIIFREGKVQAVRVLLLILLNTRNSQLNSQGWSKNSIYYSR